MKKSEYKTACGIKFSAEGRKKASPLIISQALYVGKPHEDFKDWAREECANCPERKHKTKHQWLPKGAKSLRESYMTLDTYCLAKKEGGTSDER